MRYKILSFLIVMALLISSSSMMVTVTGYNEDLIEKDEDIGSYPVEEYPDLPVNDDVGRIGWKRWIQTSKIIPRPLGDYTPRSPIRINDDTDFAEQADTEGWAGDGTEEDPYIIQGYEIDGEILGNCIFIGNTTVHFEVRDNYVYNASGNNDIYFRRTGIYLHEVTNGIIVGNIGYNNGNYGIYLESSQGNILEGNMMYENRRGIKLIGESHGNIIRDNVANNNTFGINIRETSSHNLVMDNTVNGNERGIYVHVEVNDKLITNTTIIGNTVDHNIDPSWNPGYGIAVRSNHFTRRIEYTTIENNILDGNEIGIYIFRPDHNSVKNNEVKNTLGNGFWFARSDDNTVINNTAIDNSGYGFYLNRITSSDFVNNTAINNNNDGIHLIGDHDGWSTIPTTGNTITGSIVMNNEGHGIYMDGYTRSNTYSHNTIHNNTGSGFYLTDQSYDQTRDNLIEDNNIFHNGEHGIYMYESRLNELLNNTMLGNGIYIEGTNVNRWNTHTIDTNNTVDGKPVHYFKDAVGGVIPEGAGQVILANCDGTTVENQEFSNATLLLGYSEGIEIRNVTISEPYLHGVFIYRSHQCSITESTFVDAGVSGIYADLSDDLHIDKSSVIGSGSSGIHLSSSNGGVVEDTSIFYAPDLAGTGDGLEVEDSNNVVVTGNTISFNHRGIYIHTGSADYIISGNNLFDNSNDGLHLNDAGAGQLIYGNHMSGNGRHGIYISSSGEILIENNTIESNNDDGIHVRSSVSQIVNNLLADNGNDGVYIQRTADGHFINNTILNSGRRGLWSRGATGWQIVDNNISGYNDNYGISKWSSSGTGTPFIRTGGHLIANNTVTGGGILLLHPQQPSTIEGNTIIDYSDRGIRLDQIGTSYSSTGNIVANNTLTAHTESTEATGIYVCSRCSETVIENNKIENGRDGIFMGSSDNLAQRNTVHNVIHYGLFTGASSQFNIIENNTVLNSQDGLYLQGSDHSVVDNTITNSSMHGVYADNLQDTLVSNNTIDGSQDSGIEIYYSSNLEVYDNTILDASQHGIHLSSSNSCVLKGNQMHGVGIMITGWDVSNWNSHTIYENNTVNDLPVIYLTSLTDGSVSGNVGQVIIADCGDMMISNLTIEKSGVALLLGFSDDNIIVNSTFVDNSYGIYLHSSNENMIYHNNFINNMIQAHDGGINAWDSGYPSGGNHWSDWTGPDEYGGPGQDEPGSDGIVDEPRDIAGGFNQDNYPWTVPGGWDITAPIVVLTSPTYGDVFEVGSIRTITWNTVPGDRDIIGVDLDYSIDGGDTWINIVEGTGDTGTYPWLVPDDVTNSAHIRIFVYDDIGLKALDVSDQFSILVIRLNIESTDGGDVTVPGQGSFPYAYGEVVDLVATNQTGHQFIRWEGDVDTIADIYSYSTNITMEGNYSVTAVFEAISHDLTVDSTDGGTVTVPGEDTFPYDYGTVVDLVAVPDTGHHFVHWSGDVDTIADTGSNETTITIHGDYSITAVFAIDTHDLTVDSTDGGTVTVPGEDTVTYDYGTTVDLVAVPDTGHHFVHWSGDVDTISDTGSNETTITIHGDYSITAVFAINTYELTVNVQGDGSVDKYPDLPEYEHGSEVTLIVDPDPAWEFSHWTGDHPEGKENDETITITMDDDKSLTVHFVKIPDTIPPSIEITSPGDGETLETATVTIYWGTQQGTYPIDHHEIRLNEGDWSNVGSDTQYTFEDLEDGTYTVTVRVVDEEGLTDEDSIDFSIDIPDDPEFIPVNATLNIDPEVGYAPLTVSITFGAENLGGSSGSLELLKDGTGIHSLEIPAQDTAEHTLTYTFSEVGEYELKFFDQTVIVVVQEQIGFEPVNLTLDVQPTEGTVPLEVTITVSGENIGEEEGSIAVSIDGITSDSLIISSGESNEMTFDHIFEDPGTYLISFYDLSLEVVVLEEEEMPPDDEDPDDTEPEDKGMSIGMFLLIGIVLIILMLLLVLWWKKGTKGSDSPDEDIFEDDENLLEEDENFFEEDTEEIVEDEIEDPDSTGDLS